jgi:hypothetical protein
MPYVTIAVFVSSGWNIAKSFEWKEKTNNMEAERNTEDKKYADDVRLISHTFEHMQRKMDDLWDESKKVALAISSSKTKEMCQYNSKPRS